MFTQFLTVGLLMLLAVMVPGPDFALVTKNTIFTSRRAGIYTALGISCSNLVHITYCILGLAIFISQSPFLFNFIKYIGASYMIYIGIHSLLSKPKTDIVLTKPDWSSSQDIRNSSFQAFKEGFICNLFNPKATLFFLALFTVVLPETKKSLAIVYAIEMFVIITGWFFCLTFILSHPLILNLLNKAEKHIAKVLGIFLIGFGISLFFYRL